MRTVEIISRKKSYLNKFSKVLPYILELNNLFIDLAIIFQENNNLQFLTSPYNTEKIPRLKGNLPSYRNTSEIYSKMYSIFQILGFGVIQSFSHRFSRQIKSVIALRKKGKKASLPHKKSLNEIHTYSIELGRDNFSVKDGYIIIRIGKLKSDVNAIYKLKLPTFLKQNPNSIKTVSITYIKDSFLKFSINYDEQKIRLESISDVDPNKWISIDLGYHNLITVYSPKESFIITSSQLKDFLHWYHNLSSELQSRKEWRKFRLLKQYKKTIIKTYLNTIVNRIIDYCVKNKIGTIIIGNMTNIFHSKSSITNVNKIFRNIPYGYLLRILKLKAKDHNIEVSVVDESYTSVTDPFDNTKKLKRTKSKSETSDGLVLHADIVGAFNIAKKVFLRLKPKISVLTRPKVYKTKRLLRDIFNINQDLRSFLLERSEDLTANRYGYAGLY